MSSVGIVFIYFFFTLRAVEPTVANVMSEKCSRWPSLYGLSFSLKGSLTCFFAYRLFRIFSVGLVYFV